MNVAPQTDQQLQHEVRKEVIRHALISQQGGCLLLLWGIGAGLFWLRGLPGYVAIWTAASLVICTLAVSTSLRAPDAIRGATREVLQARFPVQGLADVGHRAAAQKANDICVELLVKARDVGRWSGADGPDLDVVPQVGRLLSLQYESARRAEEFRRVLGLAGLHPGPDGTDRPAAPGAPLPASGDPMALHRENVRAIQREADEAEALVGIIADQLETLLLQVLRIDERAIDVVTTLEARREAVAALERLQQTIDARRTATTWLLGTLAPGPLSGEHDR